MSNFITLNCTDQVVQFDCENLTDVKYSRHKVTEDNFWVEAYFSNREWPIYMSMDLDSVVKLLVKLDPTGDKLVPLLEAKLTTLLEEE